jgi:hypothetical protein
MSHVPPTLVAQAFIRAENWNGRDGRSVSIVQRESYNCVFLMRRICSLQINITYLWKRLGEKDCILTR